MKQTMHTRFLASEKRRRLQRDEMIKATEERVKAVQLLEEANRKLYTAERVLEEAHLRAEGWVKEHDWGYSVSWRHSSGFDIIRGDWGGRVRWAVRRASTMIDSATITGRRYYSTRGAFVETEPSPPYEHNHLSLEEALEWWRLATTNLGRYPEPPRKGLFDRLREGSV